MPDAHKNFAYSTVATAPSPASSGTSLTVASGGGALFPAPPFNAVVWPTGEQPLSTNAEIVRVTAISTDTLTITRTQEGTSARSIIVGDQISAAITAKTLTDAERKTLSVFWPLNNYPPSSNYATLDTRASIACLDFDDTTAESAVFVGVMPDIADVTRGLVVYLHWAATSATSGNVIWEVSFARLNANNQDIDSITFDTVTASSASAANGTSGKLTVPSITVAVADTDGISAGEMYAIKVRRLPADAGDTMAGDAELYAVEVRGG